MTMLTRDQAASLAERVLAMSKADEAVVTIDGGTTTHLRFAQNSPSTSGSHDDLRVSVASSFGTRTGQVTVNQTDEATLRGAIARSEEIARLAPEDPEFVPALGAQEYPAVAAYDPATASGAHEALARGVAVCTKRAIERGLVAAGYTEAHAGFRAIASSRGLFGYHTETTAYVAETARTPDGTGSGWASSSSHRAGDLDYADVSQTALGKAESSRAPRPLAPGTYPAILEPACVANLVANMLFSMDARRAAEGRSYFAAPAAPSPTGKPAEPAKPGRGKRKPAPTKPAPTPPAGGAIGATRLGERLFPASVTIRSDPSDPRVPGAPWGTDGLPQAPRAWIDRGAVSALMRSRYWASQHGGDPVPFPPNVMMTGGTGSVADLIASTERGVLVTSLWYIRSVDPRTLLYTGLTRDGVYWIEDGKIAHPVQNFRWNDSPISVLKHAVAMSAPVRVPPRPWRSTTWLVPAIATSQFHFASVSEAV